MVMSLRSKWAAGETYRRLGVSAYRRLQSVVNFVETSWSLQPCREAVLLPQTPIRQYADPPTRFPCRRPILIATIYLLFRGQDTRSGRDSPACNLIICAAVHCRPSLGCV